MNNILKHIKSEWYRYGIDTLVVIVGVLIAFSLNNWRENIINKNKSELYIVSIVEDLKLDTAFLGNQLRIGEREIKAMRTFKKRLSSPYATIDTIKHIARYDFQVFYNPSNFYHKNTLLTLQNNGDIELLDPWIRKELINLSSLQEFRINHDEATLEIYKESLILHYSKYPFSEQLNIVEGPLLDRTWANVDENEFIRSFNNIISSKDIMTKLLTSDRQGLYNQTVALLEKLTQSYF